MAHEAYRRLTGHKVMQDVAHACQAQPMRAQPAPPAVTETDRLWNVVGRITESNARHTREIGALKGA